MQFGKQNHFLIFLFSYFLIFIVSLVAALRDFSIGKDTYTYVRIFNNFVEGHWLQRLEPGFLFLLLMVEFIYSDPRFFLFIVTFLITVFYFIFFYKSTRALNLNFNQQFCYLILFFSLLFFSSWYFNAFSNGIRQGLSLVLLYLGLYSLVALKSKTNFLILYLFSASFHYSSIAILPFLLFYALPLTYLLIVWVVIAILYPLGVNELIVTAMSDLSGVGVYDFIKNYSLDSAGESGDYSGFNLSFFLYTVFWPLFLFFIQKLRMSGENEVLRLGQLLIKIYILLSLPYFVFGFGPYSNRFAVMAWFFIPMIQLLIFASFRFKLNFPFLISLIFLFFFSLIFLVTYRLELFSH
ncbi:MAG: EpsG family protein [Methyloprofundus sp.]|nr:EpsG family protein [Methyloprofundus sp.]